MRLIKRQGRREERAGDGDGAGERRGRERERVRKERREKKGNFKEEMGESTQNEV